LGKTVLFSPTCYLLDLVTKSSRVKKQQRTIVLIEVSYRNMLRMLTKIIVVSTIMRSFPVATCTIYQTYIA